MIQTLVAILAAGIALASAVFAGVQTREMRVQTKQQREIARDAVQPYVWADLRSGPSSPLVVFVLGNSGPTVATDIRVQIDPPLPVPASDDNSSEAISSLGAHGLSSLSPGREMLFRLGEPRHLPNLAELGQHRIQIDCKGPHGPTNTLTYVVDLRIIWWSLQNQRGSARDVARSIDKLSTKLSDRYQPVCVELLDPRRNDLSLGERARGWWQRKRSAR